MHLWVIKTLEPLGGGNRLLRAGLIARMASAKGMRVTWWNSRIDRVSGRARRSEDIVATRELGIDLELLRGPRYHRAISMRRFLHDLSTAADFVRRTIGRSPPDIIYCSMPPIELTVAAVAYARRHEIPVVVDVRDIWPDLWGELAPRALRPIARLTAIPYRRLLTFALTRADALFACGEGALAWALARAGRERRGVDGVFPHAVAAEPLPPHVRREAEAFWEGIGLGWGRREEERLRLVFAGALTERAGCLEFLRTFLTLPADLRKRVRIVVAGSGAQAPAIRELAVRDSSVIWTDWLDRARLWTLYERCDVGVAPYRRTLDAGWILVNKFCEYIFHGLPVLTTLTGEVERFVREHGCGMIWSGDAADLSAKIARFMDRDALKELRRNARTAGKLFDADRVYGEMIERLELLARYARLRKIAAPTGGTTH